MLGSQSASCGKDKYIARVIRSTAKKGQMPLTITSKSVSGKRPFKTKRLIPKGGVMRAISHICTIKTPNQIRLISSAIRAGRMIGRVMNIAAIMSRKKPKMRYSSIIPIKITIGGTSSVVKNKDTLLGMREIDRR